MLDSLKPNNKTTVNQMLAKDDIPELLKTFNEKYAADCLNVIIVFITKDHEVYQIGDKGMPDDAKAIGILDIAKMNIYKNGLCHD